MERGTVSGRVALLLRSTEVKPLFKRFVQLLLNFLFFAFYHARTWGPVRCDLALGAGMNEVWSVKCEVWSMKYEVLSSQSTLANNMYTNRAVVGSSK